MLFYLSKLKYKKEKMKFNNTIGKLIILITIVFVSNIWARESTKVIDLEEYKKPNLDQDLKELNCYQSSSAICMDPHFFNQMRQKDDKVFQDIKAKLSEKFGSDPNKLIEMMNGELTDTKKNVIKNEKTTIAEYAKSNKIYSLDSLTVQMAVAKIIELDQFIKNHQQQGNKK